MHSLIKALTGIAAAAVLGAVLMAGTARVASAQAEGASAPAPAAAPAAKKPKDTGEYDIANATFTDMQSATPNWQKAVTDLTTWAQKYPESDWKNDWPLYYLQAYNGLGQKDKALQYSAQLLGMDVPKVFPDKADQLKIYYETCRAVSGIHNATPEQLATGDKGAKALLAFIPTFFTDANKPKTATDAQWNAARKQLETAATDAELYVASYPGDEAAAKSDWAGAETAYRVALKQYPDNWSLAYGLGSAILREKNPATFAQGLYFIARAVAMDPAKGGIADASKRTAIDNFLKQAYTTFHGGDDGLDQLKQQALASPFPAADFKIATASEVAAEKQKEFQDKYPQVALWMQMKGMLAGTDSDAGFAQMKDTMVKGATGRGLTGQVISGEPACRSKSLLVAVPIPGSTATLTPEITLKLDKALTGKPVAGATIQWDGVPSAFTKDPFMLTMDVQQTDIDGLTTDPCTPPVTHKAPPKSTKKK